MGRPDQTEKMLLDLNDEFAEVFSALAFKHKLKLKPEALHEAATEYHHLEQGKPKELRRDIVKLYDGLKLGIIVLGIENQSEVDSMMPIRMMGYDWTRYRYQMCHAESLPPQTMLSPVFSHVINFSYKQKWDWPFSLKDIVWVPPQLEEFFQDYTIDVTNVAWLTPQERSLLKGDFKILADTLCAIRETGKIPGGTQTIRHADELLATLAAVTHREYCIDLPDDQKKQGDQKMTMDDVLTKWEQGLRAEGYANGEKVGYENGEKVGYENGEKVGYENGEKVGYENGEKVGYENGKNSSTVRTCQDLGKTEDETIHYLMQKYGMTRDEAHSTTVQYWQS